MECITITTIIIDQSRTETRAKTAGNNIQETGIS